jgi:hypothetical protein
LTYIVSGQGSKSAQTSSKAPVNIAPKPAAAYRPPQSKFSAALNDKVYLKDMSKSSYLGYIRLAMTNYRTNHIFYAHHCHS